jgi:UDP-N-acetylmuramate dehydrogenase
LKKGSRDQGVKGSREKTNRREDGKEMLDILFGPSTPRLPAGRLEPFRPDRKRSSRGAEQDNLMLTNYQKEAQGIIQGSVLFNAPLRRYTSMKVGGPVDALLFPADVDDVRRVVHRARKKSIPLLILGKGTNLIVKDRGVRGWAINLTRGLRKIRRDGDRVDAEAGGLLQRLVQFSAQKSLTGFEPFTGIPGTVGGGLAMNAGAWGAELKDLVLSITLMEEDGKIVERSRSNLEFSYRGLLLPPASILLKARFQLRRGDREEIRERIASYSERRKRSQPLDDPSAGSIFKNPREARAGKVIDEIGLKGFRIGQAMVSERHGNFIVNLGNATAAEIIQVMEWVEKKVYERKGISLEREVKVVGE